MVVDLHYEHYQTKQYLSGEYWWMRKKGNGDHFIAPSYLIHGKFFWFIIVVITMKKNYNTSYLIHGKILQKIRFIIVVITVKKNYNMSYLIHGKILQKFQFILVITSHPGSF